MTSPLLSHRTVGSLTSGDIGRSIAIEQPADVDEAFCSGVIARIDHETGVAVGQTRTFVGLAVPGDPMLQQRGRRWPSTQLCTVM